MEKLSRRCFIKTTGGIAGILAASQFPGISARAQTNVREYDLDPDVNFTDALDVMTTNYGQPSSTNIFQFIIQPGTHKDTLAGNLPGFHGDFDFIDVPQWVNLITPEEFIEYDTEGRPTNMPVFQDAIRLNGNNEVYGVARQLVTPDAYGIHFSGSDIILEKPIIFADQFSQQPFNKAIFATGTYVNNRVDTAVIHYVEDGLVVSDNADITVRNSLVRDVERAVVSTRGNIDLGQTSSFGNNHFGPRTTYLVYFYDGSQPEIDAAGNAWLDDNGDPYLDEADLLASGKIYVKESQKIIQQLQQTVPINFHGEFLETPPYINYKSDYDVQRTDVDINRWRNLSKNQKSIKGERISPTFKIDKF